MSQPIILKSWLYYDSSTLYAGSLFEDLELTAIICGNLIKGDLFLDCVIEDVEMFK
jgi:hypothetical protein